MGFPKVEGASSQQGQVSDKSFFDKHKVKMGAALVGAVFTASLAAILLYATGGFDILSLLGNVLEICGCAVSGGIIGAGAAVIVESDAFKDRVARLKERFL